MTHPVPTLLIAMGLLQAAADPVADSSTALQPVFNKLDADSSNGLSLAEHLAGIPEDQQKIPRRDFLTMDVDSNGELSFLEFLALKGIDVPDPWIELAAAAFQNYQELAKTADENGDGALARSEWPKETLQTKLRGFGSKTFSQWDANQNGQVTEDEARRMIDVGFALCLPTGEPARWPNGSVLYWSHYRDIDKNRDGVISRAEFVAKHPLSKEKNEALFKELDKDGDDKLTYAEVQSPGPFVINLVNTFNDYDTDFDGKLSAAELAEHCPPARKNERGLELGLAVFDADGDGKYSLNEFRLSPLGALHITVPLLHCKDANQDGALSYKEFASKSSPLFAGIAGEVYRRYDRDQDGQLTIEEYDFPEDPEIKQFAQQVQPQVRAALIAELHYFLSITHLTAEQRQLLKPIVRLSYSRLVRQLAGVQKQMNRGFNANSPPQIPDPQTSVTADLRQFAREHLPQEIAAQYEQEIGHRETHRRNATVRILVSRLDRDLLLSADQREKVTAALVERWQPVWLQQVEYLLQNEQMVLALPEAGLVPHLTNQQKAVWQAMPKTAHFGMHFNGGVFQVAPPANEANGPLDDLLPAIEAAEANPNEIRLVE